MQDLPHVYKTRAVGKETDLLNLSYSPLADMSVSAPVEFGGPEGYWNPEAFFSASISSCFILTFRAVSRAMKLSWQNLEVNTDAILEKNEIGLNFTKVIINATLSIPSEQEGLTEKYQMALDKAKKSCLVTNSLKSEITLNAVVKTSKA